MAIKGRGSKGRLYAAGTRREGLADMVNWRKKNPHQKGRDGNARDPNQGGRKTEAEISQARKGINQLQGRQYGGCL